MLRLFLAVSALVWLPYGLWCFFDPTYLAGAAGVAATSATGTIELRAMYGGLQAALGALAGAAFFRPALRRPALLALAFTCGGLFTARLLAVVLGAEVSPYTAFGLLFEILSSTFATRLAVRLPAQAGAPPEAAERERVVRRHMEAENVHDFDTVIGTFSHPRYELIATDRIHDGEEAVREYFRETRSAFPDQRNELISLRHADDAVVAEFWLLGTHRGPLMGIEPTGRSFRCRMAALFLFEGVELRCERVYFDSASILRQLTA